MQKATRLKMSAQVIGGILIGAVTGFKDEVI